MAVNLIPTSFITEDDKKLSVVDVYTETKEQISNSVFKQVDVGLTTATTVTNEVKGELVKSITAVKSITSQSPLQIALGVATGSLTKDSILGQMGVLDKKSALEKLKSAINPNLVNDIKGNLLTGLLKGVGFKGDSEALVKGVLGLPGGKTPINVLLDANPKLKVIYNAVDVIKTADNLDNAKGVASLLTSLTGNSELAKVLDMESQFSAMGNVMTIANFWNVPSLVDKAIDHFDDDDDKRKFAIANAPAAINSGGLYMINKITEIAGIGAVISNVPQAISRILSGYRLPAGLKEMTSIEAQLFVDTLSSLNPNWFQYQRNGVWVSNLEPFQVASADAIKAFKLLGLYTVEIAIAKTYPKTNLIALSKKRYPKAGL